MSTFTLRIPLIPAPGPLQQIHATREFHGGMPEHDVVGFFARIIRDGLESVAYPEFRKLSANSDEWLVQQVELVMSVPDHVWIRNGFDPLGAWNESRRR